MRPLRVLAEMCSWLPGHRPTGRRSKPTYREQQKRMRNAGYRIKALEVSVLFWLACLIGLTGLTPARAAPLEGFDAVRYQLDVTYDPDDQVIRGKATISTLWKGRSPLTDLYFFLPPNTLSRRDRREPAAYSDLRYAKGFDPAHLSVHQVTSPHLTGTSQTHLSFRLQDDPAVPVGHVPDRALLHISLPRPLTTGEHVALTISFTTRLPAAKNWGYYHDVLSLDGRWYPLLVPNRQGQWIWGLQEFVHAHYDLRFTTQADQHVLASVPWQDRQLQQDSGRQILSGSAGPLYHLGLSSSRQQHAECDQSRAPTLCLFASPKDQPAAARLVSVMRSIVDFYRDEFQLSRSANTFSIVVHERDLALPFSASADNLFFLSLDIVRLPSLLRKLADFYIARGLAQQQWGLRTAYNLNTSSWIGEGLATYFASRWLDHQYGPGRNFLTWKSAWLPNFSYRDQGIEVPYRRLAVQQHDQPLTTGVDSTSDIQGLRFLQEKKGALVYAMLHNLLGPETFRAFLRRLTETSSGRVIRTQEVQQAAEAVSQQDLAWFFQQWVEQQVQLDYAVGTVVSTPQPNSLGPPVYLNRVDIHRLGEAIMPVTIRLTATDGKTYDQRIEGADSTETITWQHGAPLTDVHIDPDRHLPDVQRLNNTSHIAYTVRPFIDFPHLDQYLVYPFITHENNFVDGNVPRLSLVGRYLDDQAAAVSIGYKETPRKFSLGAQFWRQRFPHPNVTSFLTFTDRQGAQTLSLDMSLLLEESHRQNRLPVNYFTLGYHVAFLQRQETLQNDPVPEAEFPSTGRIHSLVFSYRRDARIPSASGAPLNVLSEPLTYGYALQFDIEVAAKELGSNQPDFQQLKWEGSEFLRLWNQTSLQLRIFGGWSAGTVPFQRKLTLAGVNTIRGYPYRLRFLGDRLLGGTLGLRFPILRDIRLDAPGRFFSLRSAHISPFIDAGWLWNTDETLSDTRLRSGVGIRLIAGLGVASLFRFEIAVDVAHALDARGLDEDEGVQVWLRVQSTAQGGVH